MFVSLKCVKAVRVLRFNDIKTFRKRLKVDNNCKVDIRGGSDHENLFHMNVSGVAAVYASSSLCHFYGYMRLLSLHLMLAISVTNEVEMADRA